MCIVIILYSQHNIKILLQLYTNGDSKLRYSKYLAEVITIDESEKKRKLNFIV